MGQQSTLKNARRSSGLSGRLARIRSAAETFVNERWYGKPGLLLLLAPFELAYVLIAQRRKERALAVAATNQQARLPTIVIGNLVAGGTGKTPVVIETVAQLKALGASPAVVTRGYGGSSTGWPLLVTEDSDPQVCGDEAVEIAQATGCPVVAGPDRRASIAWLVNNTECTLVVSDDGLQHYSMARELEIVLVDAERLFGNGHRLPVGPLREAPERLRSADLVLLTSRALNGAEEVRPTVEGILRDEVPALGCALEPCRARSLFGDASMPASAAPFANQHCIALTGIGAPKRFYRDLEALGCDVHEQPFADHESYAAFVRTGDLQHWLTTSWVVTTGKDAVKLRRLLRATDEPLLNQVYEKAWVLERRVVFSAHERSVFSDLLRRFKNCHEEG